LRRLIILGLILLLTVACGAGKVENPADGDTPADDTNDSTISNGDVTEEGFEGLPETFTTFTYKTQAAMGFCPGNFLEVSITRQAQDQFEFSATLVEETGENEGQPCLETGMEGCLVARPIPNRLLEADESQQLLKTLSEVAFENMPEWCQDLEYDPCLIELYRWDNEQGDSLEAGVYDCQDPHLTAASHAALQELFSQLSESTSAGIS